MKRGRRKPYTAIGIRRLKCYRCKVRPAVHQWQICADGNVWRPICVECDVALNRLVLIWIGDPDAQAKISAYRTDQLGRLDA